MSVVLKGVAWGHTRAVAPLLVASQVYHDFHPEVHVQWDTRSLFSFGETSLEDIARGYDLVLLDHPFMGTVAAQNLFIPLDQHIEGAVLKAQQTGSLGKSFESYHYNGHLWALAIDAAAQVSALREDIFLREKVKVPSTWEEVMQLARHTRKVAMPMTPMGLLGSFFTLCANQGEDPFSRREDGIVDTSLGESVIEKLQILFESIPSWCLEVYPPAILHKMITTEEVWYVPLTYGYVNYSMRGYALYPLKFSNIPIAGEAGVKGSVLGGVGIAVSSSSKNIGLAVDFSSWVTSENVQKTLYAWSGGQPANRNAWTDTVINATCNNFYRNTLDTLDQAFVRPRYNGFHNFQSAAGRLLQSCMRKEITVQETLTRMTEKYIESKSSKVVLH